LEQLKRAADRRLGSASEKLADLLLDKAKEGKMESTQLLVKLAETQDKAKAAREEEKRDVFVGGAAVLGAGVGGGEAEGWRLCEWGMGGRTRRRERSCLAPRCSGRRNCGTKD